MPFAVALLFATLFAVGDTLDRATSLNQSLLFGANHLASLGGVAIGAAWTIARAPTVVRGLLAAIAVVVGWRVAYFPIMVFSGQVASVAEWLQQGMGMSPWVYPVFLINAAALHTGVALLTGFAVTRASWIPKVAALGGLALASAVSFTQLDDLGLLPDRVWTLDAKIPERVESIENPYLPAVSSAAYGIHQRVMLVAAGLTYETIPDAPWARGVRAALEDSFRDNPVGSTQDRVLEHYMAYHSAHALIGP